MPWGTITLNDGRRIPDIAFGSAQRRSPGAQTKSVQDLAAAIDAGFTHLDTAAQYGNEADVGEALRGCGLAREDVWVTTKWSDGNIPARESCVQSLKELGVDYIDLYVIHHTWTCKGDIAGAWRQMEEIQRLGLAKSIGLSAFGLEEVKEVLASCTVVPAVNMIMLNPNTLRDMSPLLDLMSQRGIVPGGYSPLKPLWDPDGNPAIVNEAEGLARRKGVSPEHVLLRWCSAKGAVVFTSSTSRDRVRQYLLAGDVELTAEEVASLDKAGMP